MDGGGGSQIRWVWGWSGVGWWSVAANALESLVEHGLRSIVKIGARRCMAGYRRGGSVMREEWAEIWVDRCLWVMGVWPARDLGNGPA